MRDNCLILLEPHFRSSKETGVSLIRKDQLDSGSRCGGTFPVEDFDGPAIEMICALFCLANTDNPELAKFRKCANQMKRDAFARRGVEVQTVYNGDVNKIIRRY